MTLGPNKLESRVRDLETRLSFIRGSVARTHWARPAETEPYAVSTGRPGAPTVAPPVSDVSQGFPSACRKFWTVARPFPSEAQLVPTGPPFWSSALLTLAHSHRLSRGAPGGRTWGPTLCPRGPTSPGSPRHAPPPTRASAALP